MKKLLLAATAALAAASSYALVFGPDGKEVFPTSVGEILAGGANHVGTFKNLTYASDYVYLVAADSSVTAYLDSPFRKAATALDGTTYFWSDKLAPSEDAETKCYYLGGNDGVSGGKSWSSVRGVTADNTRSGYGATYEYRFPAKRVIVGTAIAYKLKAPYYMVFPNDGLYLNYGVQMFNSNLSKTSYNNQKIVGNVTFLGYTGSNATVICPTYAGAATATMDATEDHSAFEFTGGKIASSSTTSVAIKKTQANCWPGDVKFTGDAGLTDGWQGYLELSDHSVYFGACGLPKIRQFKVMSGATVGTIAPAGATVKIANLEMEDGTKLACSLTNKIEILKYATYTDRGSMIDLASGVNIVLDLDTLDDYDNACSFEILRVQTGDRCSCNLGTTPTLVGRDPQKARFASITIETVDNYTVYKANFAAKPIEIILSPLEYVERTSLDGASSVTLDLSCLATDLDTHKDTDFLKLPISVANGLDKNDILIAGTDDQLKRLLYVKTRDEGGNRIYYAFILPADYTKDTANFVCQTSTAVPYSKSQYIDKTYWGDGTADFSPTMMYYSNNSNGRSPALNADGAKGNKTQVEFAGGLYVQAAGTQWKTLSPASMGFPRGWALLPGAAPYMSTYTAFGMQAIIKGVVYILGTSKTPVNFQGTHANMTADYATGFTLDATLIGRKDAYVVMRNSPDANAKIWKTMAEVLGDGSEYFGTFEFNSAKAALSRAGVVSASLVKLTGASTLTTAGLGETVTVKKAEFGEGSSIVLNMNDTLELLDANLDNVTSITLGFTEADIGSTGVKRVLMKSIPGVNLRQKFETVNFTGLGGSVSVNANGDIYLEAAAAVIQVDGNSYASLEGASDAIKDDSVITFIQPYVPGILTVNGKTGVKLEWNSSKAGSVPGVEELRLEDGATMPLEVPFYVGNGQGVNHIWLPVENRTLYVGTNSVLTVPKGCQFNSAGTNNTFIIDNGLIEAKHKYPFYIGYYADIVSEDGSVTNKVDSGLNHLEFYGGEPKIRTTWDPTESDSIGLGSITVRNTDIVFHLDKDNLYQVPVMKATGHISVKDNVTVSFTGLEEIWEDVDGEGIDIPLVEAGDLGECVFLSDEERARVDASLPDGCYLKYVKGTLEKREVNKAVLLHVGPAAASVIIVDGKEFGDPLKAWAKIENGSTVQLIDDVTVNGALKLDSKEVTIDLNGHTLDSTVSDYALTVSGDGGTVYTVTLTDTTGSGSFVKSGAGTVVKILAGGSFAMDEGEYTLGSTAETGDGSAVTVTGGTFFMAGGTIRVASADMTGVKLSEGATLIEDENQPVTLCGGTLEAGARLVNLSGASFYFIPGDSEAQFGFNASSYCEPGYHTAKIDGDYYTVVEGEEVKAGLILLLK